MLEVTRQFRDNKKSEVQILRRQILLRPADAKTILRCQGDTFNEAVVDFPASTREHMHYVGLSGVQNSSALHILNLNENKRKVTEKVKSEMSYRLTIYPKQKHSCFRMLDLSTST